MTPGPYTLLALALVAWRTWALLSRDSILDRVRDRLAPDGGGARGFLECPYCAGFWCAGFWVILWDETSTPRAGVLHVVVGWAAVSAAVVFTEALLERIVGE